MSALTKTADIATRRLPKVFTPSAHRAADYLLVGSFVAAGAWFFRRNRRAALGAWISGASLLGLTLLTSYSGKRRGHLAFPLHGKIETGMAAMVAAMPEFLRLQDDKERHYFTVKAGLLTVISNLTAFSNDRNKP
jgi:uncharacterized membrane protein